MNRIKNEWIARHGVIRIGYLKSDAGVSLVDADRSRDTLLSVLSGIS